MKDREYIKEKSEKMRTKKTVFAALFAALTCVMTMLIKVPSPLKGYLNLGDSAVLVSGWFLGPAYGFAAAAIGSALADLFGGYAVYVPATFVIKGTMALLAFAVAHSGEKPKLTVRRIISGIVAEAFMVLGYFVFEGFLYGFAPSLLDIPANILQGAFGIVLGVTAAKVFEKSHIEF